MGSIGQAAVTGAASATVTIEAPPSPARASYRMTLRTPATTDDRRVQWHQQTVDNENMGKKKSKSMCKVVHERWPNLSPVCLFVIPDSGPLSYEN